jgi:hypothetical protein
MTCGVGVRSVRPTNPSRREHPSSYREPFDSVAASPTEAATPLRGTLLFEFHMLNIFDQTAQKLRAQAAEFFH